MRAALWLLGLFAISAAVALFAGNNQGIVTIFWPPTRVDLSLNLVLLGLVLVFVLLQFAQRALTALFLLPVQARQWRMQQKERAMHAALLDAMVQLVAGRFTRSRKAAQAALVQERSLAALGVELPQSAPVRVLAHLLAAESAQALQDAAGRDSHWQQALNESRHPDGELRLAPELREGIQLRAARWALEDGRPAAALAQLSDMPQGAQRRTLALRLRLKAARQDQRMDEALETASLLAKHRAFSPIAARGIMRALASRLIERAHDAQQLRRVWADLEAGVRALPEVAIAAARRMVALQFDVKDAADLATARQWLLPSWELMASDPRSFSDVQLLALVRALEDALNEVDSEWLARIESAQRNHPRNAHLQYLAGMACVRRQLWGKAQQLLSQAAYALPDVSLRRRAWVSLAELAQARGDDAQALTAWKQAARVDESQDAATPRPWGTVSEREEPKI